MSFQKISLTSLIFSASLLSVFSNAFELRIQSSDLDPQPVFSEVRTFHFNITLAEDLQPGVYENPVIENIEYQVMGVLESGTPSEFPAFDLMRDISGEDFYAQGSSLMFEISESADLSDGLQLDELVGNDVIFTLNAREVGNGRFHPPLFELRADGSGRIQNSNNIHTVSPERGADFGEEYITDLSFSLSNVTFVESENPNGKSGNGGGVFPLWGIVLLFLVAVFRKVKYTKP